MGPSRSSLSLSIAVIVALASLNAAPSLRAQVSASPTQVNFSNTTVGQQTNQTVNFTVGNSTLGSVSAVTQGAANADYSVVSGGTTCASGTTNTNCTVEVQFMPAAAGSRYGALVLSDMSGNTLISVPLFGIGTGPVFSFVPGMMSTVIGGSVANTTAGLNYPNGVGVDSAGNVYVGDTGHNVVRKLSAAVTTTVAGGNGQGYSGDGGPATSAKLYYPTTVRVDGAGNIYIVDDGNNAVRMINPAGIISTVAGLAPGASICGAAIDQWGDGCPATQASLDFADSYYGEGGTATDAAGNLYIGDTAHNLIRKVGPDGTISIFAGTGTAGYSGDGGQATNAQLNNPDGGVFDSAGNFYFADLYNNVIRKVALDGTISTVAGNGSYGHTGDGGPATSAELGYPYQVAIDAAGDLYITDSGNFTEGDTNEVIRKVALNGIITTVAGLAPSPNASGQTYGGDGGPATSALMWGPVDIVLDAQGNFYIADDYNHAVRKVDVSTLPVNFGNQAFGVASSPQNMGMQNIGNANLNIASIQLTGTNSGDFAQTNNCVSPIAAGGSCQAGVTFTPTAIGARSAALSVTDDAPNSPQSGPITGTGVQATTTTAVGSSSPTASYGQPITLTATVSPQGTGTPTGTVNFYDAGNSIGSSNVSGGMAMLMISSLTVGSHSITASYSGDTNFKASMSSAFTEQVNQAATAAMVTSSAAPAAKGQSVTYTGLVSSPYGNTLTGNVTLKDGSTTLGVFPVGQATYTTSYSAVGLHSITATYSGDSNNLGSTSPVFNEYIEVLPVTTTTTVATSGTPSAYNQSVTFTARVSSTYGAIPDGETVDFYDGTNLLGAGMTSGGTAAFSTAALSVATHSIKATYAGDASFKTSSGTVSQVVTTDATATTLSSSLNPSNYGQSVTLTAQVTTTGPNAPTGTVSFKNGTATLGSPAVNGSGVATFTTTTLGVGTATITASYNGDPYNGKSTSTAVNQTINQAQINMTITSTPNPSITGELVKFTIMLTSNGSLPTGSITFSYNGSTLGTEPLSSGTASFPTSTLPAGSDVVTASFAATTDYSAAQASITQVVNGTTTMLSSSPNPSNSGQSVTFTAQVIPSGSGMPTGTVTFKNGTTTLGTGTVNAGIATYSTTKLPVGTNSITAAYGGDANNGKSTSSALMQVVSQPTD